LREGSWIKTVYEHHFVHIPFVNATATQAIFNQEFRK